MYRFSLQFAHVRDMIRSAKMKIPPAGDVLLRGSDDTGFELVNPHTLDRVDGPFVTMFAAVQAARALGAQVWQQSFDNRGRPLGDPFPLLDRNVDSRI
jgi:hypothetical protein